MLLNYELLEILLFNEKMELTIVSKRFLSSAQIYT